MKKREASTNMDIYDTTTTIKERRYLSVCNVNTINRYFYLINLFLISIALGNC